MDTTITDIAQQVNTQTVTLATILSTVGFVALAAVRQLAPIVIKRFQTKLEIEDQDEHEKTIKHRQDEQLVDEAKTFLSEAARDQMTTIKTLAEECQGELKDMRKVLLEAQVERAELKAKDDIRTEEIERISKDLFDAKAIIMSTKEALDSAQDMRDDLQKELYQLKSEMDRVRNQVSILESRLYTEQQTGIALEKRLQSAEAELKIKDQLLAESKILNEALRNDVRDLQNKLKEYMTKTNPTAESLITQELLKKVELRPEDVKL
jgi:chromosome segregation ATPase